MEQPGLSCAHEMLARVEDIHKQSACYSALPAPSYDFFFTKITMCWMPYCTRKHYDAVARSVFEFQTACCISLYVNYFIINLKLNFSENFIFFLKDRGRVIF